MMLVEDARQMREANHGTTHMRILRHFEIHLVLNLGWSLLPRMTP